MPAIGRWGYDAPGSCSPALESHTVGLLWRVAFAPTHLLLACSRAAVPGFAAYARGWRYSSQSRLWMGTWPIRDPAGIAPLVEAGEGCTPRVSPSLAGFWARATLRAPLIPPPRRLYNRPEPFRHERGSGCISVLAYCPCHGIDFLSDLAEHLVCA